MSDESYDDGSVDETAFFKALASDVDEAVSLKLLMEVYDTNDMWADFQDEDIQQVVETFSILNMAPGEKLITKGEYATFCGIVLQGTFSAIVSPTFTVALTAGEMVGEMSLFEGGARNADIITGTDVGGCILAVITFVDLDNLAMNERYSQLARKLTTMFATASIKKLRGMLKPAGAAPTPADGTPLSPTLAPTAAAPGAPVAKKERVKKEDKKPVVAETLYKNKMSKAAAAPGTAAASTPKNIGEAQSALEEQQAKLKKIEHSKRNQQVMLDRATKSVRAHEETIRGHEETIARLQQDLTKATDTLNSLTARFTTQAKALDEATDSLERERKQRHEIESKLTLSAADLTSRNAGELAAIQAQLAEQTRLREELEQALAGEKEALASLIVAKDAEAQRSAAATSDVVVKLDGTTKDLQTSRNKAEQLDTELKASLKHADEQRATMSSMSLRLLDLDEKLSAAMSWKLKALELQSGLDAEKKRHVRLSDDWTKTSRELETELKHYKLLLKTFAITIYAKEFRLRKLVGGLHKRVSEMLLTTLEEHYNTSTGKEKAGKAAAIGGGAGGAGSAQQSISSTFKSVRRRKKVYLDNLLRPSSKLRDVVASLDDEVSKLKGPFEEIRERCLHWRATSESFFQRNIDLASKLMALDKNLAEVSTAKDTASAQAKHAARDLEKLTAKHADLSARVHGGGGASATTTAPQRATEDASNTSSSSVSAKHASKQELELLEARATVLRVHVQQLEAHYLQLQAAIHNFGGASPGPPGHFQESKQGGGPEHAGSFDPNTVSPLPFPAYATTGPYPPQAAHMSPRTSRTGVAYHPPPSGGGGHHGQQPPSGRFTYAAPLSPRGGAQSTHRLPAVAGAYPHPHPAAPYGGVAYYASPSQQAGYPQPYPPSPAQPQAVLISTPQQRATNLSFSPR